MAKSLQPIVDWVLDCGNTDMKDMLVGGFGKEDIIPHAFQMPNDANYGARVQRAKYQTGSIRHSAIFQKNGTGYVIGEAATQSGQLKRITGTAKYQAGYFDVLVSAKLLRRFPQGHNNIRLAIAHPPDAIAYVERLMDLVGGVHKVTTITGEEVKFVIREVVPWDEPAGGLMRFMTLPEQAYNPHDIRVGYRLLVIDIGGKISSMTPVVIGDGYSVEPLYESAAVFDIGVQDVADLLKEELRSLYPVEFQDMRAIPFNMLDEALRTNCVTLANEPFACGQAVLNAVAPILDRIQGYYKNNMASGRNFNHIVVTGGGGGLLFDYLANQDTGILNHRFVHLADMPERIQIANLRGGAEAFKVWLNRQPR
jgi:hypothetical protein